jgi:hypothetical protein
LLGLNALAYADVFLQLPNRATQQPTDIVDWSQLGPDFTPLSSPAAFTTFNGVAGVVSDAGGSLARLDEGTSWIGNFDYGENLLWTFGQNGPLTLMLSSPVNSFGFDIQENLYGPFTATVAALDASMSPLFTLSGVPGLSNGLENGSALFLGIADASAVSIWGFQVDTTDISALDPHDFAIDDVSFTNVVPEPGFTGATAALLAALAGLRRWRS